MSDLALRLIAENKASHKRGDDTAKYLDLGNCGLTALPEELFELEKLSGLQSLNLNDNQISDLRPLEKLADLKSLDLRFNQISNFPKFFLRLPNLNQLNLSGNSVVDVPAEIINQGLFSNCLFDVKNYFHAWSKGAMPNDEVKLFLLGNGRVGKTSIMRAMLDREFDENEESTEKVVLRVWALPDAKTGLLRGKPIQVNIWDFGGQEIYYTTHRLFLRTKALFLLVWDKETEASQTHEDGFGHIFENFKLLHWIDYIRSANQELVIVVQNKVDDRKDKYTGFEQLLQEHYDKIFDFQYVSAKKDHKKGLPALRDCIRDAYSEIPEVGQLIGRQWMAVRNMIRKFYIPRMGARSLS